MMGCIEDSSAFGRKLRIEQRGPDYRGKKTSGDYVGCLEMLYDILKAEAKKPSIVCQTLQRRWDNLEKEPWEEFEVFEAEFEELKLD